MRALRELTPEVEFRGAGGREMRELAGGDFFDWADEAVVGLWDVLKKYGYFKEQLERMAAEIVRLRPAALILIDYPGFNLRLAQKVRAAQPAIKIIYYISPQVWAWNRERIPKMARYLDLMLCIFPFERPLYEASGLRTVFVGHPMLDSLAAKRTGVARDPALVEGPRCSELLAAAAADADVVLVDTAAASAGRRWPLHGEHSHLVMVPAGAEAVTAAYGFIKQHAQNAWHPPLGIVVSRVASVAQGEAIHANLSDVAKRFLARPLPLAGVWGSDLAVPLALRARQTVNATDVEHAVSRRCADIANQLIGGAPNVAPSLPVPWLARLLRAAPSSTAWSAT